MNLLCWYASKFRKVYYSLRFENKLVSKNSFQCKNGLNDCSSNTKLGQIETKSLSLLQTTLSKTLEYRLPYSKNAKTNWRVSRVATELLEGDHVRNVGGWLPRCGKTGRQWQCRRDESRRNNIVQVTVEPEKGVNVIRMHRDSLSPVPPVFYIRLRVQRLRNITLSSLFPSAIYFMRITYLMYHVL